MRKYKVICWASEEITVEAESEEEAEQIAADECRFPCVDYCETYELEIYCPPVGEHRKKDMYEVRFYNTENKKSGYRYSGAFDRKEDAQQWLDELTKSQPKIKGEVLKKITGR